METLFRKVLCSKRPPIVKDYYYTNLGNVLFTKHKVWTNFKNKIYPVWWLEELQPQEQVTVAQLMDIAQHIEDEMVTEDEDVTISEVQKTIAQAIHELVYGEKQPKAKE